jgi:16S rRNA (uracil1498-N3)-methyltransferase
MPIDRFFDSELTHMSTLGTLKDDEMLHALKVFRLKIGDNFEVINGHGLLAQVTLTQTSKKHLSYTVHSFHQSPPQPPKKSLIVGMPKFNRLELIVEKACELGIEQITVFNADKSEKLNLSHNQLQRLHAILVASLKQCGRLFLPTVELKSNLAECFESDKTYFFGDLTTQNKEPLPSSPIGFIIGPESGLSDHELALCQSKAIPYTLSQAVLRVDTAAICAAYIMGQN